MRQTKRLNRGRKYYLAVEDDMSHSNGITPGVIQQDLAKWLDYDEAQRIRGYNNQIMVEIFLFDVRLLLEEAIQSLRKCRPPCPILNLINEDCPITLYLLDLL